MTAIFRAAVRDEVPAIAALLLDDILGAGRETNDMARYFAAFDAVQAETDNHLIVADMAGLIVGTYQISFLSGLSLNATRRAQIEAVRIARSHRGQGLGVALFADAEARARAAGCGLMQLTTNKARDRAQAFYDALGFTASHVGYKRTLD